MDKKVRQKIQNICAGFVFAMVLCTQIANAQSNVKVFHLQNFFSEAYLVKGDGEKLILVETGVSVPNYGDTLIKSIKDLGFKPENISLAIVTHGHGDHSGNAKFLQEKFHIPIAGHKGDLDKFQEGKSHLGRCVDVGVWGARLRPLSDLAYQPFTPDVIIDKKEIDLSKYGVKGKIIPIDGGHTPGELFILIGEHLFVGDAFCATFKAQGQGLIPDGHHVREHFFHENRELANEQLSTIEQIAIKNNVSTIYPTHFGAVATKELTKYIKERPLLSTLSKLQDDMLAETVNGKCDIQKKYMCNDSYWINTDGKQYSKSEFIQNFITNPKTKIESLAAEDYRIIYSDANTAVMSYLEMIKMQGKEPKMVFVTATYVKTPDHWKLVFQQSTNL